MQPSDSSAHMYIFRNSQLKLGMHDLGCDKYRDVFGGTQAQC